MSEEIWKIEKNLCRCCHAEGDFDNLAEPRVYLEQEEIYFNMLRECFNIEIPPVPGELCAMTYSICEVCILRLQDASSFKKQVQHSEERFMALYCNNSVKVLNSKKPLIKLENSESDTDYNEDFNGLNDENDEEYKIDMKEDETEVFPDNPNSDEDRYLTLKKGKTKIKPKSHKSKHTPKIREDIKKSKSSVKEKKVLNSKRTSIKLENSESDTDYNEDFTGLNDENDEDYKVDIKQDEDNPNSDEDRYLTLKKGKTKIKPKSHKSKHTPKIKEDVKKAKNSVKEKKGDMSEMLFTVSTATDGTKDFSCNICQHVFKKRPNFQQHYKHVHLKQRPKLRSCHLCDVKVPGHMRAFHMEEHGLPAPSCGACGKKFSYPFQVLQHQKYYHMGERKFACEYCDLKFRSRYGLTKHTIKHTGVRSFICEFCDKSFKWKNNLRIHLMMHLNDKRHVCSVCDEAFVQTSSLKYHIMKRHPDLV